MLQDKTKQDIEISYKTTVKSVDRKRSLKAKPRTHVISTLYHLRAKGSKGPVKVL